MKTRKPSIESQEKHAAQLLANEIIIRKACLETANKKVDELIEKIKSGDKSKKVQRELADQREIVLKIRAWINTHEKTA